MGKTAANERIKLEATFFNNLGVGCYIAGAVAPAFPFYQNYPVLDQFLRIGDVPSLPANLATAIFIAIWCVVLAVFFRNRADKIIQTLD